ncbi:MAG: GNAT family N-acetyltransferase [Pirellulales bacterium]
MATMHQIDELMRSAAAARYPKELSLAEGSSLTLTPMVASDWPMMEEFLRATPDEERRFFRRDASDPARVERWCSQLDYGHVFPLFAWRGKSIGADVILERDSGLWTSHVAKVRLLVKPAFRGRGLGRQMISEVIELARLFDLHKLCYECAADQHALVAFLSACGFNEAARLEGFIRDRDGAFHDMVIMVYDLAG